MSIQILVDFTKDSAFKNRLREIFNKYDPIKIYQGEDINVDEYDSEIVKIVEKFNTSFELDTFTNAVHLVFIEMFDEEIAGPRNLYFNLAKEVYEFLTHELKQL